MLREKNACIFDFCMSKHFVSCNNVRETGTRFISNITKILCLFIVVNYNNDKVLSFSRAVVTLDVDRNVSTVPYSTSFAGVNWIFTLS